ncbi:GNAT family N-acetyltransferase [Bacillus sp. ISL-51]|uniref:peptidoglycan bridge formation glycyltransferase FemA/FemB family protein n=1 Tax=Bacteria TaxID=2 RepID=UPI001BE5461F|nr:MULTISPECIES: peptidoglycan bridge formation glycyltransferase FemA/FemB family protein [Bacteria]MBT2572730.1 GNAT family N-acetyltransferase [Bacillus sp. ISL-51]MBT2635545.1 GNAT family N-acetyltransferase [Bacillus sp. ISL-26]MBT2713200.1 GNAT family N-acetyltransferase [Pseudomonas sp. ISL-88]
MQKTAVCTSRQVWDRAADMYQAGLFQSYDWGKLMEELPETSFHPVRLTTDGGQVIYMPIFEQRGTLSGSMIGYGGVISDRPISFEWLQSEIQAIFGQKMSRLLLPYGQTSFIGESESEWTDKMTHILALPDTFDELWTSISGKARTAVRYAEKESVIVRQIGQKELGEFYELYKEHTAAIGSAYVLSPAFFQKLLDSLADRVYWVGAFLEQKLISSSIFLYDGSHFYYWQNVNSLAGKKAQASYLLMRDALQFAIRNKLHWADFGYSHSKEIARPKRYWGAEEKRCRHFTRAE